MQVLATAHKQLLTLLHSYSNLVLFASLKFALNKYLYILYIIHTYIHTLLAILLFLYPCKHCKHANCLTITGT